MTREKDNVFLGEIPLDNATHFAARNEGPRHRPHRRTAPGVGSVPSAVELSHVLAGLVMATLPAPNPSAENGEARCNVREAITATLKLRGDLIFMPDLARSPEAIAVEDPLRGKFFHVGVPEHTLLIQLDGRQSIAAAVGRAAAGLGPQALSEREALALCRWAAENQLALPLGGDASARIAATAARHRAQRVRDGQSALRADSASDPDRLLRRITNWCGAAFTWPVLMVWAGILGYALYLACSGWAHIESSTAVILDRDNWLRLPLAWVLLKILHETAHGLACKHFGGAVGTAGITLLFFMPLAYVDVTSSWRFRSKWQRIATAAAGVYAELFVASIATIVWAKSPPGIVQTVALNIALTAGVSTLLFNANPLVRFDGYFILSDLLGYRTLALAANSGSPASCKRACWAAKSRLLPGRRRKHGSCPSTRSAPSHGACCSSFRSHSG